MPCAYQPGTADVAAADLRGRLRVRRRSGTFNNQQHDASRSTRRTRSTTTSTSSGRAGSPAPGRRPATPPRAPRARRATLAAAAARAITARGSSTGRPAAPADVARRLVLERVRGPAARALAADRRPSATPGARSCGRSPSAAATSCSPTARVRNLAYMGVVGARLRQRLQRLRRLHRLHPRRLRPTRTTIRSRTNVNQPGAAEGPGFRHQTYEPVPIGYAISPPDDDAQLSSSPVWAVDQIEWERLGGRTAGTTTADEVTLGELALGKGVVRVIGALLPMPTEQYYHPFGLANYAVTYSGYQVLQNALQWERPLPDLSGRRRATSRSRRAKDQTTITATVRNVGQRRRVPAWPFASRTTAPRSGRCRRSPRSRPAAAAPRPSSGRPRGSRATHDRRHGRPGERDRRVERDEQHAPRASSPSRATRSRTATSRRRRTDRPTAGRARARRATTATRRAPGRAGRGRPARSRSSRARSYDARRSTSPAAAPRRPAALRGRRRARLGAARLRADDRSPAPRRCGSS